MLIAAVGDVAHLGGELDESLQVTAGRLPEDVVLLEPGLTCRVGLSCIHCVP